jgi:hypothetical protein
MSTLCAWCQTPLKEESGGADITRFSICERCVSLAQTRRIPIADFMKSFDSPVLFLDAERRIVSANTAALLALDKKHTDIEDRLCGEVIECGHSHLPEGCGHTVHCTGCQIRMSVEHTVRTGQAVAGVLAVQHSLTAEGVRTRTYSISTEKSGDETVILKMEEIR